LEHTQLRAGRSCRMIMRLGRAIGIAVMFVSVTAAAQQAPSTPSTPSAATVLANVQAFYASQTQMTADFHQVVTQAAFGNTGVTDGSVRVAKPALFRFDYLSKKKTATKSFIFDGKILWVIDVANKQIFKSQVQTNAALPAAVSFLTGASNLTTQFNVALNTSGKIGSASARASVTVLELTPKQASAQFTQLFFVVDPATWAVNESIVIDSSGNTQDITFGNPDFKAAIKPTLFQVDPKITGFKLVVVKP
jgi:outer membrane lipoprotein-sorting protein